MDPLMRYFRKIREMTQTTPSQSPRRLQMSQSPGTFGSVDVPLVDKMLTQFNIAPLTIIHDSTQTVTQNITQNITQNHITNIHISPLPFAHLSTSIAVQSSDVPKARSSTNDVKETLFLVRGTLLHQ